MRFHKSETAFFVFIAVILAAGVVTLHAYGVLCSSRRHAVPAGAIRRRRLSLESCCSPPACCLTTALFFGMFFIFPLIRTQVKEEGKLRAMTVSLSAARRRWSMRP